MVKVMVKTAGKIEAKTDKELVRDSNIILIGGHDNFRKKLEKEYGNIKTISPDQKKANLSCLNGADLVVFITAHINHVMWQRVKKYGNKCNLLVLNRQHNTEILVQHMADKLRIS